MNKKSTKKTTRNKKSLIVTIAAVIVLAIAVIVTAFLLTGQSDVADGDSVKVGQKAKIYIGDENSSIGTSWQIKSISDQDVISDAEIESKEQKSCPPDAVGCYSDAYLTFVGKESGQTTIVVEQCYRGDCSDAQTRSFDITIQ